LQGCGAFGWHAGTPPAQATANDRRKVIWEVIGCVASRRDKMGYPRFRELGLPVSSASGGARPGK